KALEKDRIRRYETASGLAADVQRHLSDEPVQACPPSAWYRFRKLARRNRAALTTAILVAAALVLGTAVSTWQAIRAMRAEHAAGQQRLRPEADSRKARDAVDQMLTEGAEPHLANVPQMEPVRRALLLKALAFYEGFLRERGTDPMVRLEAGKAYLRVGEIQRLLGEHAPAEQAVVAAIALAGTPGGGAPATPEGQELLSRGWHELGRLREHTGRRDEAEHAYRQTLRIDRARAEAFP